MLTFIVNPNAGGEKGYRVWKRLERRLIKQKAEYQVYLTGARGEAREIAYQLTEPGAPDPGILVAVGGDGVMNEVVDGVRITDTLVLGYIPTGKNSDLKRGLRLPRTPAASLKKMLSGGEIREVDYGVVDYGDDEPRHRRFLVNCGCGFDAAVTEVRREFVSRHFMGIPVISRAALFLISCRALFRTRTVRGYVVLDEGRRVELNNIFLLSAQIQPTAAGLKLGAGTRNTDGEFTVCILHNRSRIQLLRILLTAFFRNPAGFAGVRSYGCRELRVSLEEPVPMHTDGEDCGEHSELHLRGVRRKLKILC